MGKIIHILYLTIYVAIATEHLQYHDHKKKTVMIVCVLHNLKAQVSYILIIYMLIKTLL